MANDLTAAIPTIYGQVLQTAQANSIMPRVVTNNYSDRVAQQGQTIEINNVGPGTIRNVTPGSVPDTNNVTGVETTGQSLTLSYWKEVVFQLSYADVANLVQGIPSRQLSQNVADLTAYVDEVICTTAYQQFYQTAGTAGTTPFASDAQAAQDAATLLNVAKAPKRDRKLVLDPYAEGNAAHLPILQTVNQSGQNQIWVDGSVNGKMAMGWEWYMDQGIQTHNTAATGTYAIDASGAIGDTTIVVDNGAGAVPTASLIVGDKFTIAGSTQQYTVISVTAGSPANADTYGIRPALDQVVADGDLLTVETDDYVGNLAFQMDAIHFASRPVEPIFRGGKIFQSISDPVSGLNFLLKIADQHYQTEWALSILFGVVVPRPEWGVVVYG